MMSAKTLTKVKIMYRYIPGNCPQCNENPLSDKVYIPAVGYIVLPKRCQVCKELEVNCDQRTR